MQNVKYGQIVLGPPGSGKTSYCAGMCAYLESTGRKCSVVNLDPANGRVAGNDMLAADIRDLICVDKVMASLNLGPNGSLLYCMEFLEENIDWLLEKLENLGSDYVIFDFPGQVELYTHHQGARNIASALCASGFRMVVVYLVDAPYCLQRTTYISATFLALATMLHMELPHVNVLSKVDLVSENSIDLDLDFNFSFTHLHSDVRPVGETDDAANRPTCKFVGRLEERYVKFHETLTEMIEDFQLVHFETLTIMEPASIKRLAEILDKTVGYVKSNAESI